MQLIINEAAYNDAIKWYVFEVDNYSPLKIKCEFVFEYPTV